MRVLGAERALALLAQTVQTEQQGGLLTLDGTRRRTLGGVYFKLIEDSLTKLGRSAPNLTPALTGS